MHENSTLLEQGTVFPLAYGNEEETGMIDDSSGGWAEPHDLVDDIPRYLPRIFNETDLFLSNGFKVYKGGTTILERATPECSSPSELVARVRASERLLVETAGLYAIDQSLLNESEPIHVRIQRRVVDSQGSRKACHDNFGLQESNKREHDSFYPKLTNVVPALLEHLSTRSFVTGAGFVRAGDTRFAQKIDGLDKVQGYGFFGSMFRTDNEHGDRLEVRCSDINISDWATKIRIGSVALILAFSSTPIANEFNETEISDEYILPRAKDCNYLKVNPDHSLKPSQVLYEALDFQQRIAELAMDELPFYLDEMPDEYFVIASELYKYCEDFRSVLDGSATIDILADRADWAAKMKVILEHIDKSSRFEKRKMGDYKTRALDLHYDRISLLATEGQLDKPQFGYGYKLRAKRQFRSFVSDAAVELAYKRAPTDTRAHVRSFLLDNYPVSSIGWNCVVLDDGEYRLKIPLEDVQEYTISDELAEQLQDIKSLR